MGDNKENEKLSPEEERKKKLQCYASRGPGPASVNLPPTVGFINHDKTRNQMPAYSLSSRWKILKGSGQSPGPAYLIATGLTSKGPYTAPAYTLRPWTKVLNDINKIGPGPAAYLPDMNVNRNRQPSYSLRSRTRVFTGASSSPGPIYLLPSALGPKIPDKTAAAECTLKGRGKDRKPGWGSAGYYDIGSPDLIKNRGGAASIKGRHNLRENRFEASPASYNLQNAINKIRPNPPCYSLGIRHTECSGTMITSCDKADDDNCGCNNNAGDTC